MVTSNLARVVFWMTGALLSFSTMAVSIRGLGGILSIMEILALRAGGGLVLTLVVLAMRPGLRHEINTQRLGLQVVRNGMHFVGQMFWANGLLLLPLATVFALEFTMPAWTVLLAALILGERMTPSRLGVVALGLAGVLVILRPGLGAFDPATLLVLAAALAYALTMISTKILTRNQSTFAIVFWMNLIQLPLGLAGSDPTFLTKLSIDHILPVIGIAVAGSSAHFCLSHAFRAGDAGVVVPLDFLRIPLIALVGWALYSEPLDGYVFLGAGIIISGVMWNLRAESRRSRVAAGTAAGGLAPSEPNR